MLHHILIYSLLAHAIWALPAPVPQLQHPVGDIASHIVIVTPQAQVHLEPVLKYDTSSAFIQHLTPLARFASPHEETIVYYPASAAAAAPLVPLEAAAIARADATPATKQTVIEQIQTAIQTGAEMYGPQLSEAAASAAAAAASAGSSFFPANLFPPIAAAGSSNSDKDTQPQVQGQLKSEEKTPAATQPLISDGRRFYALAPAGALPQIIDFVHTPQAGPVLVSPVQVLRARSIANPELPVVALPIPEAPKPEALPLNKKKTELKENKETKKIEAEKEKEKIKSNEFGRFLEANALREQQADEAPKQQQSLKEEISKPEQPIAADSAIIAEPTAQTLLKADAAEIAAAAPQALQAEAIANDALPAAMVA